jgi:hypothetical protein
MAQDTQLLGGSYPTRLTSITIVDGRRLARSEAQLLIAASLFQRRTPQLVVPNISQGVPNEHLRVSQRGKCAIALCRSCRS